jgi:hypothetical protein
VELVLYPFHDIGTCSQHLCHIPFEGGESKFRKWKHFPHGSFKHFMLCELTVVVVVHNWSLNVAVSVKTTALDGRTIVQCAAVGGMRIGRGNQRTQRKPAPVPLSPPQIPHDLNLD